MDDPLFSVPWTCGEGDCPTGWHLATYWSAGNGFTVDDFTDGDHEDCDEVDIPSHEAVIKAWNDYYRDCGTTGSDPLGELSVARTTKSVQRWQVEFRHGIAGVVLTGHRRNGRGPWGSARDIPQELRESLCLEGHNVLAFRAEWLSADGKTPSPNALEELRKLAAADENVSVHNPRPHGQRRNRVMLLTVTVEVETPRLENQVAAEIRAKATNLIKKETK